MMEVSSTIQAITMPDIRDGQPRTISGALLNARNNAEVDLERVAHPDTIYRAKDARADFAMLSLQRYVSSEQAGEILRYANNPGFHEPISKTPDCKFLVRKAIELEVLLGSPGAVAEEDLKVVTEKFTELVKGVAKGSIKYIANHTDRYGENYKKGEKLEQLIRSLALKHPEVFDQAASMMFDKYLREGQVKSFEKYHSVTLTSQSANELSFTGPARSVVTGLVKEQLAGNIGQGDVEGFVLNMLNLLELHRERKEASPEKKFQFSPAQRQSGGTQDNSGNVHRAATFLPPAAGGNINNNRSEGGKVELNLGDLSQSEKVLHNLNELVKDLFQHTEKQTVVYLDAIQKHIEVHAGVIRELLTEVSNRRNAGHVYADAPAGRITTEQQASAGTTTEQSGGAVVGVNVEGTSVHETTDGETTDAQQLVAPTGIFSFESVEAESGIEDLPSERSQVWTPFAAEPPELLTESNTEAAANQTVRQDSPRRASMQSDAVLPFSGSVASRRSSSSNDVSGTLFRTWTSSFDGRAVNPESISAAGGASLRENEYQRSSSVSQRATPARAEAHFSEPVAEGESLNLYQRVRAGLKRTGILDAITTASPEGRDDAQNPERDDSTPESRLEANKSRRFEGSIGSGTADGSRWQR